MPKQLIIDIADMKASLNGSTLVTYALGSCIGMAAYDPVAGAGALLHFMLPDSQLDPRKAAKNPYMFADTGIYNTFLKLRTMGCKSSRLIVKVAGGSNIMDPNGIFNIGKRNLLAIKKNLWKFNIAIKAQDVGGSICRNMKLNLGKKEISVRYSGTREEKVL